MSKESEVIKKGAIKGAMVPVAAQAAIATAGFTAQGVAAGSLAAATQSVIGNVAAGSLFSGLQWVGATTALVSPVGLAIGAVAGIGFAISSLIKEEKKPKKLEA